MINRMGSPIIWLIMIPLVVISTISVPASVVHAETMSLFVPKKTQEQSNWCWAAVTQSIMAFHGTHTSQCNIVMRGKAKSTCPNETGFDSDVQRALSASGFRSSVTGALSFNDIKYEIATNRLPFYVRWNWSGGGGHAVAVDGFSDGTTDYVDYMNPLDGEYHFDTYDWFKNGPGHTWGGTVYRISK
jgi:hypothetical protein